uniref:Uncharacterized protein n=1 Tax=Apteryx owenii TaxID=8824 RepID=A0A8B9P4S6_APTOW
MSVIQAVPSEEVASPILDFPSSVRVEINELNPVTSTESPWCYYSKPVTLIVVGGMLVVSSIVIGTIHFTKYADVPYALGPVCLSIGLMFLVTGIVWIPIVNQTVRYKGLLRAQITSVFFLSLSQFGGSCHSIINLKNW